MPEIGTSSSMSGDGKRGVGHRPQATAPILDSTDRDKNESPDLVRLLRYCRQDLLNLSSSARDPQWSCGQKRRCGAATFRGLAERHLWNVGLDCRVSQA